MKKVVLVFSLLIIFAPTHSMNFFTPLDPSLDEKQRGILGSLVRKFLKNSGMFNEDLIGLGSQTERARTQKIWADLEATPGDPHLQKQFCERQGMASSMALSLIAQLEELCTNNDADQSSASSSSFVPISQESSRAFELIELSIALRKLHAHKSLPPEQTTRLVKATNQTRQRIKKRLCITDGNNAQQDAILKEEPLFDEKIIETLPRQMIIAQALHLLKETPITNDPKEQQLGKQLAQLTLNLAPDEGILAQANMIAHKRNCNLILEEKTPPPPTSDDD